MCAYLAQMYIRIFRIHETECQIYLYSRLAFHEAADTLQTNSSHNCRLGRRVSIDAYWSTDSIVQQASMRDVTGSDDGCLFFFTFYQRKKVFSLLFTEGKSINVFSLLFTKEKSKNMFSLLFIFFKYLVRCATLDMLCIVGGQPMFISIALS